jgi:hypothetical protein
LKKLEELGQNRGAAKSVAQAKRFESEDNSIDALKYRYEINDWDKLRNNAAKKFQDKWKGPFVIVEFGHPGTYWLMTPDGRRLDTTVNQEILAPWLEKVESDSEEGDYDEPTDDELDVEEISEDVESNHTEVDDLACLDSSPLEGDSVKYSGIQDFGSGPFAPSTCFVPFSLNVRVFNGLRVA